MTNPLTWNVSALKFYETGLDRGVLYVRDGTGAYPLGVAWEGLMSISEKPGGAEVTDLWANNEKYAQLVSAEIFDGSIEAYTYPLEFLPCDGLVEVETGMTVAQQERSTFGLSYRTYLGSDAAGMKASYKIHVIYGALVQPSEAGRSTLNDSPEAVSFSWEFKTTPVTMTDQNAVSKISFDSATLGAAALTAIEDALYGDGVDDPFLPLPDALLALAQTV